MSKAAGIFLIVLGIVLMMVGLAAMGYYFYVMALEREPQKPPPKHHLFVLVAIPTILLFLFASFLPRVIDFHVGNSLAGFGGILIVSIVVLVALGYFAHITIKENEQHSLQNRKRANFCSRFWKRGVPLVGSLIMLIATGSAMVVLGLEMNGRAVHLDAPLIVMSMTSIYAAVLVSIVGMWQLLQDGSTAKKNERERELLENENSGVRIPVVPTNGIQDQWNRQPGWNP